MDLTEQFESSVNPEGIQTKEFLYYILFQFESSVNPEGIQTNTRKGINATMFESSVNPEGIKNYIWIKKIVL